MAILNNPNIGKGYWLSCNLCQCGDYSISTSFPIGIVAHVQSGLTSWQFCKSREVCSFKCDIWRLIVYFFTFTELPWNQATLDMSDYAKWKDGDIEQSPHWQRLQDNLLLSLIKKMLTHSASKRYTMKQILNHLWVKKKFKDSGMSACSQPLFRS